jgi:hypothetical protein
MRYLTILAAAILCVACGDKLLGVPDAGALANVPVTSTASVVPDSLAPPSTIVDAGDSVRFIAVTRPLCGRDTLIAGVSHDSVVVTLVETELPLPCALINGMVLHSGVVRNLATPPRTAVLTRVDINGAHADRAILAVAPRQ